MYNDSMCIRVSMCMFCFVLLVFQLYWLVHTNTWAFKTCILKLYKHWCKDLNMKYTKKRLDDDVGLRISFIN